VPNEIREFDSLIDLLEDLDREGIEGYQRKQLADRFMMRKARMNGRPYCASFELTPLCNFNCKMCYMHLTEKQLSKEGRLLSTDEWISIINQAVNAGVMAVDVTGGECLTHPGFKDIYRYLAGRGVRISVLTNGQLVTDEMIDFFKVYPPSVVQISLYGSSPEAYLHVTGRDAFQDVMDAIDRLKAANIPCKITMTPNRFMQNDTVQLLDLLHSLEVEYDIAFGTLSARPETERDIADYIVDNQVYREIKNLEMQYREQDRCNKPVDVIRPYAFRIKDEVEFKGLPCYAGGSSFHINWKGEMTPCIPYYSVAHSVLNGRLNEAWEWIKHMTAEYAYPDECKFCSYRDVCSVCPAERTAGILNGTVNPFVCKRCKELNPIDCGCKEEE